MSANKTTTDNVHSSQPQAAGAQNTGKLGGISNKVGGLGNIIHGTGMIIHGQVPGAGDPAHGGKAAIITAGRQEVERGLDRIEGKPTAGVQSGAGDGTGAAPTTAPQATVTTAAPRAEPTSQKARGATADTRHPLDNGAAANGTRGHGPAPEQRYDERTQAAANGTGVQRDTDIRQQRNGTVTGDQDNLDKETAATASPSGRDKAQETGATADMLDPVNTAAGQERLSGT